MVGISWIQPGSFIQSIFYSPTQAGARAFLVTGPATTILRAHAAAAVQHPEFMFDQSHASHPLCFAAEWR